MIEFHEPMSVEHWFKDEYQRTQGKLPIKLEPMCVDPSACLHWRSLLTFTCLKLLGFGY